MITRLNFINKICYVKVVYYYHICRHTQYNYISPCHSHVHTQTPIPLPHTIIIARTQLGLTTLHGGWCHYSTIQIAVLCGLRIMWWSQDIRHKSMKHRCICTHIPWHAGYMYTTRWLNITLERSSEFFLIRAHISSQVCKLWDVNMSWTGWPSCTGFCRIFATG